MRIYTVKSGDGTETQVQADDVQIQSMNQDGSVLFRFTEGTGDEVVTIAFVHGDNKTQITSIPGQ